MAGAGDGGIAYFDVGAQGGMHPKHPYDRSRVLCTTDERATSALLGGHSWNIINNTEDHEVFLRHTRNRDHYIDESGKTTNHWVRQKGRPGGERGAGAAMQDSRNIRESLRCPPTAGKESATAQVRQARQLCQAAAPLDFASYSARREASAVAPPTPGKEGMLGRMVPNQERLRDVPPAPTPRVVEKALWSARRGEPVPARRLPQEHDLHRSVDQVWAHPDALGGASGSMSARLPARAGEARVAHHSSTRVEAVRTREVSDWVHEKDRLKRGDHFHGRPPVQVGGSSVKYDIISNERRHFWY